MEEFRERQTCTEEEYHMTMKVEVRVVHLSQGAPKVATEPPKVGKRDDKDFLQLEEEPTLPPF
jgi:hypothetical protein